MTSAVPRDPGRVARHSAPVDRRLDRRPAAGARRAADAGHLRSHPQAHRRALDHGPLHGHASAGEPCRAISKSSCSSGRRGPRSSKIWVSLYTPQIGEVSDERLRPADREQRGRGSAWRCACAIRSCALPEGPDRGVREAAGVARRVRVRATRRRRSRPISTTRITPCQFGGAPGLQQLRLHRVGRASRRSRGTSCWASSRSDRIFTGSLKIGEQRAGGCDRPSRPRPDAIISELVISASVSRKARSLREFVARTRPHGPSAARADHPDPPLQHRLRLLQRVRQGVAAGADRRDAAPHRQAGRARHVGRRVQRRRADAAPRSRRPDPPHPRPRHDGRPDHQRLLPGAEADRGAERAPGLDFLQISIDNVEPDEVSKKSLRLLDKKLQHLQDHATFDVNINSVLGGGIKNPEDARTINNRARELGFSTSIGIIHDGSGRLKPLGPVERKVFDEVSAAISGAVAGAEEPLLGHPQLPGQPGGRQAERLALPRRRALPLHLRGRARALLLAAARLPGRAARVATRSTTSAASSRRRSRARRTARSAASTACRRWISGDRRRTRG